MSRGQLVKINDEEGTADERAFAPRVSPFPSLCFVFRVIFFPQHPGNKGRFSGAASVVVFLFFMVLVLHILACHVYWQIFHARLNSILSSKNTGDKNANSPPGRACRSINMESDQRQS